MVEPDKHEPMPIEFVECYCHGGFVALRPHSIDGLTAAVHSWARTEYNRLSRH
jgi:hypothetical protein